MLTRSTPGRRLNGVPTALPFVTRFAGMTWMSLFLTLTARALVNPLLAVDLLRVGWRFRHRRWMRQFPFLPLPAMTYVKWRMYTAYGAEDAIPPADDVIAFARWVGRQP